VTEQERTCKECGRAKPIEAFATYSKDGEKRPLRTCKECHRVRERERQRRYIAENRDAHNRRSREYKRRRYHEDPEYRSKLRRESKEYYEENKSDVLAKRRDRYHGPSSRHLAPRDRFKRPEKEFEELLAEVWDCG